MSAPIMMRWDGEAFFPASQYWARKADQDFVVGEVYTIAEHKDRSQNSHNHEFAVVADLHASIPERFAHEPWAQTPEHLRKFALIMTRYCNTETFPCAYAMATSCAPRP